MNGGRRTLWSPAFIGPVCLRNRILRSAVNDAQADAEGRCTPTHFTVYRELITGGVGAIVSGHIYVHRSGIAGNRQLGLDRDEQMPGLAHLAEVVHKAGGLIFAQLSHAGSQADIYLSGGPPAGPSARLSPEGPMSCALSLGDIATVIEAFALAARRARRAGFDGIQIHAAHGYCLSEFLSPALNKRTDAYGGSVENRARLPLEVCRAVRAEVGRDYPLLIKLNSEDAVENGMTRAMMRQTVALLQRESLLDAVEISGLWGRQRVRAVAVDAADPSTEAYAHLAAEEFKREFDLPLILVGGIRTRAAATALIESGKSDFVAMARPLIRDPGLVAHWWQRDHSHPEQTRGAEAAFAE